MGRPACSASRFALLDGAQEVGGVCSPTHPAYARRGIATCSLDEAHARMRIAGLRYSTLGTQRTALYSLYRRLATKMSPTPSSVMVARSALPPSCRPESGANRGRPVAPG